MGKFSKAIASLSIVAILSSLVVTATTAFAAADVPSDHFAYADVTAYQASGVLQEGNFFPNRNIVRAEVAKVILEAAGAELVAGDNCDELFSDCEVPSWYATYVSTAAAMNILRGTPEGLVMPGANVNRADLMVMLGRLHSWPADVMGSDSYSDVPAGSYYSSAVGAGRDAGVACGYPDGTFRPANSATRAEAIVMIARSFKAPGVNTPCADVADPDAPVVDAEGDLEVSVSADTAEEATLPSGATSVQMVSWDFEAGDEDAVINSLTVHRFGVSDLPSNHQVYLYEGSERLTAGKTINSTTRTASFNSLNLEIDKGETRTLTVRMDVGTVSTSGEVGIELEAADAVVSGGSVSGDFPLQGSMFDTSATSAGSLTIEKNGTVPNPKVGEDDVTIAKFKMSAATEAADLQEFGLYITGNISTDAIENLELYVSGEDDPIAMVDSVNSSDVASFVIEDGYLIEKGGNKTFEVKADLNTGRADDTIKAYIDEKSDVVAIGDIYGFGVKVNTVTTDSPAGSYDGTSCTSASGSCTYSTVEGGDITISSNGPVAQDVAIAGDDESFMDFTITAVAETTFKNFEISFTASEGADTTEGLLNSATSQPNLTDIRIIDRDTGETLMGPIDADVLKTASGGSTAKAEANDELVGYYLFTDELDMEPGEERNLSLVADIENTSTLDQMTVFGKLELGSTYPEIRDVNNKVVTNTSSLVPATPITGKTMTVTTPGLSLALAANPSGENTRVKGERNVQFAGFSARCSSASDCELKDFELTGYFDNDGSADGWESDGTTDGVALKSIVGSVWLEDAEGEVVASAESVQTDGTVDFTSVDYLIEGGETVTLYAVGNIATDAYESSDAENVAFGIATAGDVTFEDDDGNVRNASGTPNSEGTGNTDPSVYVTVSAGGSLTIAVDADTPRETVLTEQAADQEIGKFKFTTTDESFVVTKLSLTNRQDGVASTDIGEYDDNVQNIKAWYTDSSGVEVSKSGTLTNGNVQFEGLDFFVPKDDDATVTLTATLTEVEGTAGTEKGDAADFLDFNIGFNNFEAVAQASGETYKASKIDATVAADSDLDFGSISFTDGDGSLELDGAQDVTLSLGSTLSLTIDDAAGDNTNRLPVGTILCVDDDDSAACTTEDIYVISAVAAGSTEDVYTVLAVDDAGDDNYDDNDPILYALPGQGYLTGSNHMHVYETKPTVTLAASSPSGSRNVSTADNAFIFNIAAASSESVKIRAGVEENDTIIDGVGTPCAETTDSDAGDSVDGTSAKCVLDSDGVGDTFYWDTTGTDLSAYARVNFWFQWEDVGGASPEIADFKIGTGVGALNTQQTAFSATACGADAASFITTEWYNCDLAMPTGTDSADTGFHIEIDESTEIADTDIIYVDSLKFYNEKLVVDIQTESDLDTYANNTDNAGAPSQVLLKEGSTTRATAYWDSSTNGASATSNGKAVFIPTTEIEVAKGTSKTYTLEVDTSNLVNEDAADDPVTFSFDLGTSSAGTVTAGDFWWYDTNATVKWLGEVASTKFSSNTLVY
ncbi:S-layer homology domain-containing protein [Candidatus Gracilibacteria bacterium]|nr:S-layer homology domain-containing protein [Candidatus Gracilibacteria bacterium]